MRAILAGPRPSLAALAVAAIAGLATGPAFANPALTAKPTILRATASTHGKVIQAIPTNAEVDVNNCKKEWCFVSWRDKFGYIQASAVASLPEGGPPPGGVYAAAPPPPVVPPYYGYGYGPYYGPYNGYGYGYGYGFRRRW